MNDSYGLKEYTAFCNSRGEFDSIYIELSYKVYLAMQSGDPQQVKWAEINNYWNTYYSICDRFN